MLRGELGAVAEVALAGGDLGQFRLEVGRPIAPMLAPTAPDVAAAIAKTGPAAVEWKLDGARIQVHRDGDAIAIFTRTLDDVTARLPEVVEAVVSLPGARVRARRRGDRAARGRPPVPVPGHRVTASPSRSGNVLLTPMFFDLLHLDGEDLLDRPGSERAAALSALVPEPWRAPRGGEEHARGGAARGPRGRRGEGFGRALRGGPAGSAWVKVKPVHTLDLVVLAVEWGPGGGAGSSRTCTSARAARTAGS